MNFANKYGFTDITPYEVVRVISNRTLEVRKMDSALSEGQKPEFVVGGFAGHCTNQAELKWDITSNDQNPVVRIRLGKNGTWKDAYGHKFGLADEPIRFYDYNF